MKPDRVELRWDESYPRGAVALYNLTRDENVMFFHSCADAFRYATEHGLDFVGDSPLEFEVMLVRGQLVSHGSTAAILAFESLVRRLPLTPSGSQSGGS